MTKEDKVQKKFEEILLVIKDKSCRQLIEDFFKYYEHRWSEAQDVLMFKFKPAATRHHHNYRGGLLDHTLEVKRGMDVLLNSNQVVESDLLYTCVFLHDLCKISEYDFDGKRMMQNKGKIPPHIYLMDEFLKSRGVLYSDIRMIVGSHHGFTEWGSVFNALTENDLALFACDYYSSQGNEKSIDELIERMPNDWWNEHEKTIFTHYMKKLEENKEYIFKDRNVWS